LGLLQFTHSLKAAFAIWCFDLTTEFQPGMLNLPSFFLPVGLIATILIKPTAVGLINIVRGRVSESEVKTPTSKNFRLLNIKGIKFGC